jgi:hypothetical protein
VTDKPFTEEMRLEIHEKLGELEYVVSSSMGVENE